MMMLPCAFWPLAEHASFGQNCFDASIGSVHVCICYSMPMDACFFNHSCPFHQIVGFYQAYLSKAFWCTRNILIAYEHSCVKHLQCKTKKMQFGYIKKP